MASLPNPTPDLLPPECAIPTHQAAWKAVSGRRASARARWTSKSSPTSTSAATKKLPSTSALSSLSSRHPPTQSLRMTVSSSYLPPFFALLSALPSNRTRALAICVPLETPSSSACRLCTISAKRPLSHGPVRVRVPSQRARRRWLGSPGRESDGAASAGRSARAPSARCGCRLPFLRNLPSSTPICATLFWQLLSASSLRYTPSEHLDTSQLPFNTTLPFYLPFSLCLSASRWSSQYVIALTAILQRVEPPLQRASPRTSETFLSMMRCYSVCLPLFFTLYHRCIPFAAHMHALHWSRHVQCAVLLYY